MLDHTGIVEERLVIDYSIASMSIILLFYYLPFFLTSPLLGERG